MLRFPRILTLALQLDPVALCQQLERFLEVHALGLLYEREDVARGLAAEAVVDLLGRVDAERRSSLLVERTQPLIPGRARAPKLGARGDQLDEIDGVADAIAGLVRIKSQRQER